MTRARTSVDGLNRTGIVEVREGCGIDKEVRHGCVNRRSLASAGRTPLVDPLIEERLVSLAEGSVATLQRVRQKRK